MPFFVIHKGFEKKLTFYQINANLFSYKLQGRVLICRLHDVELRKEDETAQNNKINHQP